MPSSRFSSWMICTKFHFSTSGYSQQELLFIECFSWAACCTCMTSIKPAKQLWKRYCVIPILQMRAERLREIEFLLSAVKRGRHQCLSHGCVLRSYICQDRVCVQRWQITPQISGLDHQVSYLAHGLCPLWVILFTPGLRLMEKLLSGVLMVSMAEERQNRTKPKLVLKEPAWKKAWSHWSKGAGWPHLISSHGEMNTYHVPGKRKPAFWNTF